MSEPRDSALRRAVRRFTLGSGPLKRSSDRIQVLGRLVVVLSFLLAPPVAVATANGTTTHLQSVAAREAHDRSRIEAVLLEDAPPPALDSGDYGGGPYVRLPVRAAWTTPGGTTREGTVLAPPGTRAGAAVPVWVDRHADITRPPLDPADIQASANLTAVLPLVGMPLATWTLYAFLCFTLDARRERRWERGWAAVEPDWHSKLL